MADSNLALLERLQGLDYYRLLGLTPQAGFGEVKRAFYKFAHRFHPDRCQNESLEEQAISTRIYKLAVEAYTVLSRSALRSRYDAVLARGHLRLETLGALEENRAPRARTLEELVSTPRAQRYARKADVALAAGALEEARVSLVTACQEEPSNKALKERLNLLYEALALQS